MYYVCFGSLLVLSIYVCVDFSTPNTVHVVLELRRRTQRERQKESDTLVVFSALTASMCVNVPPIELNALSCILYYLFYIISLIHFQYAVADTYTYTRIRRFICIANFACIRVSVCERVRVCVYVCRLFVSRIFQSFSFYPSPFLCCENSFSNMTLQETKKSSPLSNRKSACDRTFFVAFATSAFICR